MALLTDRQSLADWALRQLGGGVINIEISNDQIDDNIEEAVQYYQENHFDGTERDYIVRKITATKITVASVVGLSIGDKLECTAKNLITSITEINGNVLTLGHTTAAFGVVLAIGNTVTNGTATTTISAISLGDADRGFIPLDEKVFSIIRVLNLSSIISSGDYMYNAQYQVMMSEMRSLTTGSASYLYGMMSYLGHLDFILKKERDFRFNRRIGNLYLDIKWGSDIKIDDYIAMEVYRIVDDETYTNILNDRWLKEYTVALFKKQWGANTSKYGNMTLPGGIVYNGQQKYEEAVEQIKELRQEAIERSAPLSFLVG